MAKDENWDQYGDYLKLGRILGAQEPWSGREGRAPAHDEMLFIIFHQVSELWFRQIVHELDALHAHFSKPAVDDREIQPILRSLNRIAEIWKILIAQVDILETMTPQGYIDFRDYLGTGSGFQSAQFRLIEIKLGLSRERHIPVFHADFDARLRRESRTAIKDAEGAPSLFDCVDRWLARMPFLENGGYQFKEAYRQAIGQIFDDKEKRLPANIDPQAREKEREAIARGRQKFVSIFDEQAFAALKEKGAWYLSWRAVQAALFITSYAAEPALQGPSRILNLLMDIDEALARWRYRHALMVQRMIGVTVGTAGSSGYGYLLETIEKHRIYTDIFALSTYLIPTRSLPPLPESLQQGMDYGYVTEKRAR